MTSSSSPGPSIRSSNGRVTSPVSSLRRDRSPDGTASARWPPTSASCAITTSTSRRWPWSPTPRWARSRRSWRRTSCPRRFGTLAKGKSRRRVAGSCREAGGPDASMNDTSRGDPPRSDPSHGDADEVAEYYARGLERDRLAGGQGALEFTRTQALLQRYLPAPPAVIADVGGGPGRYAVWLAGRGYRVHLIDPVPLHIEQARAAAGGRLGAALAGAEVGDARALRLPDASADAVLLLGPLYHLPERGDRLQALAEARRVCRQGGVVIAAAISRFASTLDGRRGGYLEDPVFATVAADDLRHGRHRNPTGDPAYFTTAYFHRPEDLAAECAVAGLAHEATLAVEGAAWLLPDLDVRLADERRRAALLGALASLETEPTLLGVSAHLLTVTRRT